MALRQSTTLGPRTGVQRVCVSVAQVASTYTIGLGLSAEIMSGCVRDKRRSSLGMKPETEQRFVKIGGDAVNG